MDIFLDLMGRAVLPSADIKAASCRPCVRFVSMSVIIEGPASLSSLALTQTSEGMFFNRHRPVNCM